MPNTAIRAPEHFKTSVTDERIQSFTSFQTPRVGVQNPRDLFYQERLA